MPKSVRDFLRTISISYEFEYGDQWDESAVTVCCESVCSVYEDRLNPEHNAQNLIGLRTPRTLRRF